MTAHFADLTVAAADADCAMLRVGAGTAVATLRGEVAVEGLQAGARVMTREGGVQKVLWVGTETVRVVRDEDRPVVVRAGSLGAGLPESDLVLEPAHRVLVFGAIAREFFGAEEVFVEACRLVLVPGVERLQPEAVTWHVFELGRPGAVLTNGAWSAAGGAAQDREGSGQVLVELFPALAKLS